MFEKGFNALLSGYTRSLDLALRHSKFILVLAVATFGVTAWMLMVIPKGFFPEEDIGQIQVSTEGPEDISFEAMIGLQERAAAICRSQLIQRWRGCAKFRTHVHHAQTAKRAQTDEGGGRRFAEKTA
jgi:multidrug efflux pump subunit AcrB